MMYPTAMATAPLNNNYQYVNMGYQQQQYQYEPHHPLDEVAAGSSGGGGGGAARAPITRNANNNNNNSGNSRSGAKNKSHKTKTRPQTRQRRAAYQPKGWQYEREQQQTMESGVGGVLDEDNWQSLGRGEETGTAEVPQAGEVAQLSVSRRHSSSRGSSRLSGRVINKTNLDNEGLNSGVANEGGPDEEDHIEMDSDNEEDVEEQREELTTETARPGHRGRTRQRKESQGAAAATTSRATTTGPVPAAAEVGGGAPAKNPITTTTRRMNVNSSDNNSSPDEVAAEDEEDDGGVGPEPNGLPKYSFLRGDNFNNRNPAMQYDSAVINNNNNIGTTIRDGGAGGVGAGAEVGVASASTTPTAMELECVAGYDGGLPQYFVLEAYDSRTRKLRLNITSAFPDLPLFRIDMDGT